MRKAKPDTTKQTPRSIGLRRARRVDNSVFRRNGNDSNHPHANPRTGDVYDLYQPLDWRPDSPVVCLQSAGVNIRSQRFQTRNCIDAFYISQKVAASKQQCRHAAVRRLLNGGHGVLLFVTLDPHRLTTLEGDELQPIEFAASAERPVEVTK